MWDHTENNRLIENHELTDKVGLDQTRQVASLKIEMGGDGHYRVKMQSKDITGDNW